MAYLAETTWCPGGTEKLNGWGSHFRHGRDMRQKRNKLYSSRTVLEKPAILKLSTEECRNAAGMANTNFR